MNACSSSYPTQPQSNCCCNRTPNPNTSDSEQDSRRDNQTLQLQVVGAKCGGCATSIEQVLRDADGVAQAHMDLSSGIASVVGTVEPSVLIDALQRAGFSSTPISQVRKAP